MNTDVAEPVGLVAMDCCVFLAEGLEEMGLVDLVYVAEPLSQQPVKPHVRPLLHAALNEHVTDFTLMPFTDIQL